MRDARLSLSDHALSKQVESWLKGLRREILTNPSWLVNGSTSNAAEREAADGTGARRDVEKSVAGPQRGTS